MHFSPYEDFFFFKYCLKVNMGSHHVTILEEGAIAMDLILMFDEAVPIRRWS